jgi:bleomycin hydrolase
VFTDVVRLGRTSVKYQGASNTCWSYTGNSFLESEMIRMGKKPVPISPIYTARKAYMDKARSYVRLHGGLVLGEGGQLQDVLHVFRKYGAMPRAAYTGLVGDNKYNDFGKMTQRLNTMLRVLVKNKPLKPDWEEGYVETLDEYLGEVPQQFDYEGETYTARSFADQVIGIKPDDYIGLASVTDQPYYLPFVLLVPDNWSFDRFYNVQMNELTDVIDEALLKGYTVAWTSDVSEKGFSWQDGIAYVPEKSEAEMTSQEQEIMFVRPQAERKVTPEQRQKDFDNWQTTDDHAMHIVGLAKDQNGKEYYVVKNSWGKSNQYKGFLYASKEFVRYKTITLMLHKDALNVALKTKMNIS